MVLVNSLMFYFTMLAFPSKNVLWQIKQPTIIILSKSPGFLQHTAGQVCSHILYECAASTFSMTELVPVDAYLTGRGKCAIAVLGYYTMSNNPDNYHFSNTHHESLHTCIKNSHFLHWLTCPWGKDKCNILQKWMEIT